MRRFIPLLTLLTLAGCSGNPGGKDPDAPPVDVSQPDCDPLMPFECSLPWPSNLYLKEDPARKTGYTLTFGAASLPVNRAEVPISPTDFTRLDGYGVGTQIMVVFPNLDVSAMAGEGNIERSLDRDAPVVLLELGATPRRVPYFVELDFHEDDPARKVLFVRPAELLKEATRYVVAFRGLRDTTGQAIAPSPSFIRLRSGKTGDVPALSVRQARFDRLLGDLEAQGITRGDLTLAWDFVTASSDAMHRDLLHMRDDALSQVGEKGPQLTITKVQKYAEKEGSGLPVDANILLDIEGTFAAPDYTTEWKLPGYTGSRLRRDGSGLPKAEGTRQVRFWARVPHAALREPAGLIMYGHGLLGSGTQVRGGFNSKIANDHKLIFFAADLYGMSEVDRDLIIQMLQEGSRITTMPERLHQGLTEWVLLARAMRGRLSDLLATTPEGSGIKVNPAELFYSGISQGGIFGGTFVAISPDISRGHLGVPGNNYSLLLHRSVDFNPFFIVLGASYRTPAEQAVVISVIQLLWDSVDPVSHLRHLAQPHPGKGVSSVLLAPARGDYQVAVVTNEIAARSGIGISVLDKYDADRQVPLVTAVPYPHKGSGVVLYNYGNPWAPYRNTPPDDLDMDPHGKPRRSDAHNRQLVTFLRTGEIIDVCGGDGCRPE